MYTKKIKLLPEFRKLEKSTIKEIVDNASDIGTAIIGLYKTCYPTEWNNIEVLNGHPTVNKETWDYICNLLIEKEKALNPDNENAGTRAGLFWMNLGFSADNNVPGDKVRLCSFTLKGVDYAKD